MSWAFVRTPPGWSSVVDGFHADAADSLRGVLATDAFHWISSVLEFFKPGSVTIGEGQPLMRVSPAPRELLRAQFRTMTIAQAGM